MTVSFDQFVNTVYAFNNGRNYYTHPNQNAVVDILTGSADPFTTAPANIVSPISGPGAGPELIDINQPAPLPWVSNSDTVFLAAGTYQIRFAETDNQGYLLQGVDNVSIIATPGVPEPASWSVMIVGPGLAGSALRRSRQPTLA